jgi:Holliday junction resolvase RusA-like endonuclease
VEEENAMIVRFEVPVKPIGVNETYRVVRFGKRAGLTKTVTAKAYQAAIQNSARRAMRGQRPYARPVEVFLIFAFRTSRSDIDGPVKSTLDALNGIVYLDDAQIQRLEVRRSVDKNHPRVEICARNWTGTIAGWDAAWQESPIPDKVLE